MLKNKRLIYLLIPLNLAIWGFFIYRIYSAFNDVEEAPETGTFSTLKLAAISDSSVYVLKLSYPDPFLKDVKNTNRNYSQQNVNPKPAPAKEIKAAVPKQVPDIKYMGLIKNTNSGLVSALVMINGQSHIIKLNSVIEGIKFKSLCKDSLLATWGKERIVVKR